MGFTSFKVSGVCGIVLIALLPAASPAASATQTMQPQRGSTDRVASPMAARSIEELPQLAVGAPRLLGSKKINLVRGIWTNLDLVVSNTGTGDAANVSVTGTGKGLAVRSSILRSSVSAGATGNAVLSVKLMGDRSGSVLTVTAASDRAAETSRSSSVRRIEPPAQARSGRYRDKSNSVSFSVENGRLKDFLVKGVSTRCGGFPNPFTYSTNNYDFPNTKIARNGIVDRSQRASLFVAKLTLRISGGKVSQGSFTYYGPNRCYASERFTAKRIGG